MQEQLLGYLLGALEADEHREVEDRLAHDRELQSQLEQMHAQLATLEFGQDQYEPPLGLAARTCEMVAARPRVAPADLQPVGIASGSRMRMIDMAVAASVFLAAAALFVPALSNSHYAAQLAQCQNNLRQIGHALSVYSSSHNDQLPKVPERGNLAAAGVYAPLLAESGNSEMSDWIICPASELAQQLRQQRGNWKLPSISDLQGAKGEQLVEMQRSMGGSYGYSLGYVDGGRYCGPRICESSATYAVMADTPAGGANGRRGCNHLKRGQNVLYADGHVAFLTDCHGEGCPDNIYLNEQDMVAAGLNTHDAVIGHSSAKPIPWEALDSRSGK